MQRRILASLTMVLVTGCAALTTESNFGMKHLGRLQLGPNRWNDYDQVKTGGVNGPDVTVVVERHCEPRMGQVECTVTNAWEAGASGMAEAFMAGGFQGLAQMGGLIGLGKFLRPDRTFQNQTVGPQSTIVGGQTMTVNPMMTPMPMGAGD